VVCCSVVSCGVVWSGVVWRGVVWCAARRLITVMVCHPCDQCCPKAICLSFGI
jgi:hypothetical protein